MKKNVYEKLNDVHVDLNNIDRVDLNDLEKKKILNNIHKSDIKAKRTHKMRRLGIMSATVAGIIFVCLLNTNVRESAFASVKMVVNSIVGNYKNDFKEDVNIKTKMDGAQISIDSVVRQDNEIRVIYKMKFDDDISALKTLGSDQGYKRTSLFYTDVFDNCNILVNGVDLNIPHDDNKPDKIKPIYNENGDLINADELINSAELSNADYDKNYQELSANGIWYWEVNDVNISDHEIEQELVLYLDSYEYSQDLSVDFNFKQIKLASKVLSGDLNLSYNIANAKYNSDIEMTPLDMDVKTLNGAMKLEGYSFTNTGLKIYGKDTTSPEDEKVNADRWGCGPGGLVENYGVLRFIVKDNLGNQYLFYPKCFGDDLKEYKFSVYAGPADINKEYKDYFDMNATSVTIALYEERFTSDTTTEFVKLTDDITLNLK